MRQDDKKEYKDMLVVLSYMGSGPSVLNKLDQLVAKMEDPRLRRASTSVSNYFRAQPEVAHLKKFRLLDVARAWATKAGSEKNIADTISSIHKHFETHIASQVPQWQLIARALGGSRRIKARPGQGRQNV